MTRRRPDPYNRLTTAPKSPPFRTGDAPKTAFFVKIKSKFVNMMAETAENTNNFQKNLHGLQIGYTFELYLNIFF